MNEHWINHSADSFLIIIMISNFFFCCFFIRFFCSLSNQLSQLMSLLVSWELIPTTHRPSTNTSQKEADEVKDEFFSLRLNRWSTLGIGNLFDSNWPTFLLSFLFASFVSTQWKSSEINALCFLLILYGETDHEQWTLVFHHHQAKDIKDSHIMVILPLGANFWLSLHSYDQLTIRW